MRVLVLPNRAPRVLEAGTCRKAIGYAIGSAHSGTCGTQSGYIGDLWRDITMVTFGTLLGYKLEDEMYPSISRSGGSLKNRIRPPAVPRCPRPRFSNRCMLLSAIPDA